MVFFLRLLTITTLIVCFVEVEPNAVAQTLTYTEAFRITDGPGVGNIPNNFGISISGAGDVNNDGVNDLIIGASGAPATVPPNPPTALNDGVQTGVATVHSGVDGSTLFAFDGISFSEFGISVSGAGDVNNDGFDDVIVGSPGIGTGSARVFSGNDGSLLHFFSGPGPFFQDLFGESVSGAGDVNNDGFDDVIVAEELGDVVQVFSGNDGSALFTFNVGNFFNSVSGAGDVNNDGFDDVIVGAPSANNFTTSEAVVFSGNDGSTLFTFPLGPASSEVEVSGLGDVNNDGFDDVAAVLFNTNTVDVFSGQDGSQLLSVTGTGNFGSSISDIGDVNNDGFDDLLVGSNSSLNVATLVSGNDGSTLFTLSDPSVGSEVTGLGDINGDGISDFAVSFRDDNPANVRVFVSAVVVPEPCSSCFLMLSLGTLAFGRRRCAI